jgi:hypothetical protein
MLIKPSLCRLLSVVHSLTLDAVLENPGMLLYLVERDSLGRVEYEELSRVSM